MVIAIVALYGAFASLASSGGAARADGTDAAALTAYARTQSSISGDAYERCAVNANGGAECWGYAPGGRLGDGQDTVDRYSPVAVTGLTSGVRAISAGGPRVCALMDSGGVK